MSNLDKNAIVNLENTAKYQSRSDLNVSFSTADRNSAVFYFSVTKSGKPLLLSDENVKGHIALSHSDSSFIKDELMIDNDSDKQFRYQIPNDLLKRNGTVTMQIFIAEKGNSNTIVAEKIITFGIENSLLKQLSGETKLEYIVELDELLETIDKRMKIINEKIENGEDYVTKIEEARDKVLKTIEQNNAVTTSQTAEWQKHKLTTDDGYAFSLANPKLDDNETLLSLKSGSYYFWGGTGVTSGTSGGFLKVITNSSKEVTRIIFYDLATNKIYTNFYRKVLGGFTGWELLNPTNKDTGWLPLTLKNSYKNSTTPDFAPSYRVIDHGGYKQVYVRLGVENITNGKNVVATIPKEFAPNKIYSLGVSTNVKIPPKVIISGGDIEFHTNEADNYATTDYIIYQDSWIV